ncbi:MAG TPA: hypothetical protein VFC21_11990, partial [Bryobacteraceae bacterium]|nr:hypothetical protein [Bryobacteraceae bacterium]
NDCFFVQAVVGPELLAEDVVGVRLCSMVLHAQRDCFAIAALLAETTLPDVGGFTDPISAH